MREIAYRAWHRAEKVMGYDLDLSWDEIIGWTFVSRSKFFTGGGERFNGSELSCDLMQFTGLHDKHGKKVYEGDIVRLFGMYLDETDVVTWNDEFALYELPDHWLGASIPHKVDCDTSLEVIGNIYETPELLNARP